jgi:hypothetical protein
VKHWGVLTFVALAAVTAGCASGDYGAAAGSQVSAPARTRSEPARTVSAPASDRAFGGPANVVPNGSFDDGTSPWHPLGGTTKKTFPELLVTRKPCRFGTTALLVQEKLPQPFGAQVVAVSNPPRGSTWRFSGWVEAGRTLYGSTLVFQLYALTKRGGTVPIATFSKQLTGRWSRVTKRWTRLTVRGTTRIANATFVGARVYAKNSIPLAGWIALDGVTLTRVRSPSRVATY